MQRCFVHMLLFECPRCGGGIAIAFHSEQSSPEETDEQEITLRCPCQWNGRSLGLTAKRHFVIEWEQGPQTGSSPSGNFLEGSVSSNNDARDNFSELLPNLKS
jgi:hypothetical protein